jgi:hypothetical protein
MAAVNHHLSLLIVLSHLCAGPCKETVWVTSRNKSIPEAQYSQLLAAAKAVGIDPTSIGLSLTLQTGCPAPSFP